MELGGGDFLVRKYLELWTECRWISRVERSNLQTSPGIIYLGLSGDVIAGGPWFTVLPID